MHFIKSRGSDSGIVYAQSRKRSEELAATPRNSGIPAVCYHVGLEASERARLQLDRMADFAESDHCRRIGLLGYFGETWPQENRGACDNCLAPRESRDATTEAQKFLSCILRVKQSGHPPVGIRHLSDILTGSRSEKILTKHHDQLSTYGIGKEHSAANSPARACSPSTPALSPSINETALSPATTRPEKSGWFKSIPVSKTATLIPCPK